MKAFGLACAAAALLLPCTFAAAESLRCDGGIAAEGDSRVALYYKCGPPLLSDIYCASVYYNQTFNTVPEPFASAYVPCVATEEWIYDRGPGNLVATVRVRGGVVRSIVYGRTPH